MTTTRIFSVKGTTSGFNQAVQWIVRQPGIGNHRVAADRGTLDLSTVQVDDVIGEMVRVQMFFRRRITLPLRRFGEPLACS